MQKMALIAGKFAPFLVWHLYTATKFPSNNWEYHKVILKLQRFLITMRFTYNKLPPAQCKRIFGVKRRVWSYPIMWLLVFQIYSSLILNNIWSPAFCHFWIWDVWFLKRSTHDDVAGTMRGLSNPMNCWKGMWRQWSGHASIQWTLTCQICKSW